MSAGTREHVLNLSRERVSTRYLNKCINDVLHTGIWFLLNTYDILNACAEVCVAVQIFWMSSYSCWAALRFDLAELNSVSAVALWKREMKAGDAACTQQLQ